MNNDTLSFQSFRIGFSGSDYETYHSKGYGEGCDRVGNSQDFRQKYMVGSEVYSYIKTNPKLKMELGVSGYFGQLNETALTTLNKNQYPVFGVNPFLKYAWKWIGVGAGLHAGNLIQTPSS